MRKLEVVLAVLVGAATQNVCAGPYYNLNLSASSATMRVGGQIDVSNEATPYVPTITLDGSGGGVVTAGTYNGDGSALTGVRGAGSQVYYMDRNIGAYNLMKSSFPFVVSTTIVTGYLAGSQSLDWWITLPGYPPVDHLAPGEHTITIYAEKTEGSRAVRLYANVYVEEFGGAGPLIATTPQSADLVLNTVTRNVLSYSTGPVQLNGGRIMINIFTVVSGTGLSPKIKLYMGLDYPSRISLPISPTMFVPFTNASADIDLGDHDLTTTGTLISGGINTGAVGADSVGGTLTTYLGDGTGLSGIPTLAGSNYFTSANDFTSSMYIHSLLRTHDIDMSYSSTPTLRGLTVEDAVSKPILVYPGFQINGVYDYPYNWVKVDTTTLSARYYDGSVGERFIFDKYGLVISSGIRAGASAVDGTGGVNIISANGKIPALSSAYFDSVDGSNITGIVHTDATKVLKAGDTMSGSLILNSVSLSTGNLIFQGAYPHSIQFNNQSVTSSAQFLGEQDWEQSGTIHHRIIGYGDTHATYPSELQIGAGVSVPSNVRITGNQSMNPDIFVSTFSSVGVNTATPNTGYKLDVNGNVNAAAFYQNGVLFTSVSDDTLTTALAGKVSKTGDTMTGQLTASSFTATGTGLTANQITMGSVAISSEASTSVGGGIRVSTNVYIVGFSSATKYYGDGSSLTGITATVAGAAYLASTQTFTGSNTFNATGALVTTISSATITSAVIPTVTGNTVFNNGVKLSTASGQQYLTGYSTAAVSMGAKLVVSGGPFTFDFVRVGKIVVMHIPITNSMTKNGSTGPITFETIPTEYLPSENTFLQGHGLINNAWVTTVWGIGTNGLVYLYKDANTNGIPANQAANGTGLDQSLTWMIR